MYEKLGKQYNNSHSESHSCTTLSPTKYLIPTVNCTESTSPLILSPLSLREHFKLKKGKTVVSINLRSNGS